MQIKSIRFYDTALFFFFFISVVSDHSHLMHIKETPDLCINSTVLYVWEMVFTFNMVQECLYLCEEGELRRNNRDQSVGIKERQVEDMEGINGDRRRGKQEEMRRSGGGVEGKASQVSTFLSIFLQARLVPLFLCARASAHTFPTRLLASSRPERRVAFLPKPSWWVLSITE